MSVIKGSSNRLTESDLQTHFGQEIIKNINKMRAEPVEEPVYSLEWIKKVALLAEIYKVGNCCEKGCVTFYFLYKLLTSLPKGDVNLELFNNPLVDHFFVVAGRSPDTDPSDPRTWNEDTIICDPWVEKRSYFLGEVDFENMKENPWVAINYLLPSEGSSGPIVLQRDVLAKANGVKGKIIYSQDVMVLRVRYHAGVFNSYNHNVPMCYEEWDLPKEKHYLKHKKLDKTKVSISTNSFFPPQKQEVDSSDLDIDNQV